MTTKTVTLLARRRVRVPQVPNFILDEPGGIAVDVADVYDEELKRLGIEWTNALLAHAAQRRLARQR